MINDILKNFFEQVGTYSDDYNSIRIMKDIIIRNKAPRFNQEIKNRCGIYNSIKYTYDFLNQFNYGETFLNKLNDGTFIFKEVKENSELNASSYFNETLNKKNIFIPYHNNIYDALTIEHEFFHDTNLDINNLTVTRHLFTEYISMLSKIFFEIFLKEKYNIPNLYNLRFFYNTCFYKALKVDFQLKLIDEYLLKGNISNVEKIIQSYGQYETYISNVYNEILTNKKLNFAIEMRYLIGILLATYSYDNNISIQELIEMNENLNNLEPEQLYSILDLEVYDNYSLELTTASYQKLNNSYVNLMRSL